MIAMKTSVFDVRRVCFDQTLCQLPALLHFCCGGLLARLQGLQGEWRSALASDAALYHTVSAQNDEALGLIESLPTQSYA